MDTDKNKRLVTEKKAQTANALRKDLKPCTYGHCPLNELRLVGINGALLLDIKAPTAYILIGEDVRP